MIKRYLTWSFAAAILFFSACVDKDVTDPTPTPVITSGTADFSRYIAVGTSITAGYADGGLYNAAQQTAFPNLLAGQMKLAGGGSFTSPLFPADQANGTGYLKLSGYNTDGTPVVTQVASQAVRGQTTINGIGVTLYTKYTGDLNNYGVSGIKVPNTLDPGYGNLNGYYERLLPGNAGSNSTTYLSFVTAKPFTFFTLELGANDVLDYATSDGTTRSRALTDKNIFQSQYGLVLGSFIGKKGLVTTIPDITQLPYFHYITVPALVAAAQKVNPAFSNIYISALNASGNYVTRAATSADDIMLTFDPKQLGTTANGQSPYGLSPSSPLPSSVVLDANEIAIVQDYVTSYNTSIRYVATTLGFQVFDVYTLFNQLQNGVTQDGVTVNTNYITGGFFSLDGIHPTPRGNALITDELIKVINAKYGSNLPALDISKYNGVKVN